MIEGNKPKYVYWQTTMNESFDARLSVGTYR
jgi:hypothetical protein